MNTLLNNPKNTSALVPEKLFLDFNDMLCRVPAHKISRELVVRASRVRGKNCPVVLDACAGLGEDAFLLAAAGFRVVMYERNPVMAACLREALEAAQADVKLAEIAAHMTLIEADSLDVLHTLAEGNLETPDVIYLDPMFPARTKSAAVKKKFQIIHEFVPPCSDKDAAELLRASIYVAPSKVVVKRPVKGSYLAGVSPAYSLKGKSVRFDVFVPASMKTPLL